MNEMYKISEARGAEFESIISSCVWHGVPKASAPNNRKAVAVLVPHVVKHTS